MKILVFGSPYFVNKLIDDLSNYDKKNKYFTFNSKGNLVGKISKFCSLINSDIIYYIGGRIYGDKIIKIAFFLKKKVVMHWVGTDVLSALERYKKGEYNQDCIKKVIHFAEVTWIKDELQQINIIANIVQIASFGQEKIKAIEFPTNFSILSYVGKNREEFYGIDYLIKLAKEYPTLEIKIAGISNYNKPLPDNIKLLGWVENMSEQYKNCVLYLRLPKHDGLAFSVLEALAYGRYVGYSYNMTCTYYIESYSKLNCIVSDLLEKFDKGLLQINKVGIEYIKKNYNEDVVLGVLITHLQNLQEGKYRK